MEPLLPGTERNRGVTAKDNRLFMEAILWRVRVGGPWRDLPCGFGNWNSVFQRFRRWAKNGIFESLFNHLSGEPDFEYILIDGTIVSVHQKASGAKGGLTTKVLAMTDTLGNLVRFCLLPGQRSEIVGVPDLRGNKL